MKMRKSNFELLRIVSMLLIVAGHLVEQSGALVYDNPNLLGACLWGSASRVAVNLFLILGCWFFVDAEFSARRIIKLHANMLFYTAGITIMLLVLGFTCDKMNIVRCMFPFLYRPVWFGAAWLALLLIAPYVRKCLKAAGNQVGGANCRFYCSSSSPCLLALHQS